jgi:hypothetical protein
MAAAPGEAGRGSVATVVQTAMLPLTIVSPRTTRQTLLIFAGETEASALEAFAEAPKA